jgi:hypothetical protein
MRVKPNQKAEGSGRKAEGKRRQKPETRNQKPRNQRPLEAGDGFVDCGFWFLWVLVSQPSAFRLLPSAF